MGRVHAFALQNPDPPGWWLGGVGPGRWQQSQSDYSDTVPNGNLTVGNRILPRPVGPSKMGHMHRLGTLLTFLSTSIYDHTLCRRLRLAGGAGVQRVVDGERVRTQGWTG